LTSAQLDAGGVRSDDQLAGRYTVRSVARAMRLVQIVADGPADGLSLSDLAKAVGASKSTTLALAPEVAELPRNAHIEREAVTVLNSL